MNQYPIYVVVLLLATSVLSQTTQEDFKAESLAQAVWDLLEDPARRAEISRRFATLREELALGADECAADAVIKLAG